MAHFSATAHRPWPVPAGPWVMMQHWHDLLFAHWSFDPAVIRPLLPSHLELDTRDGRAWVGVVPFWMGGVRPRATPALPWISRFPELNLRTYVVHNGKPGVWFWSLDAANPVAVAVARTVFHLPYFNARMQAQASGDLVEYRSQRTHRGAPAAQFVASYGPIGPVTPAQPGTLDHWLTERYCLYTVYHSRVYRGDIHHLPWPLQPAQATISINTIPAAHGLILPSEAPLLHFARHLQVVVWQLQAVG